MHLSSFLIVFIVVIGQALCQDIIANCVVHQEGFPALPVLRDTTVKKVEISI